MKIKDLYNQIKLKLENISTESDNEVKIILDKLIFLKSIDLTLNKEIDFDLELEKKIDEIISKREKRMPLQYIFKEQYFRSYNFFVDERVLIPRPETEILIDEVIVLSNQINSDSLKILDIGTGSGAISISLALEIKKAQVFSVDISEEALEVAEINKNKFGLEDDKLILMLGDKLEIFKDEIKFDLIVSNPPYIPFEEYLNLELEVKNHEPQKALVGLDEDGLGFYRYFVDKIPSFLKQGGYLCCEFGYGQDLKILDILNKSELFENIQIFSDYSNIPRFFIAKVK